ncbi:DNA-binding response regulator, OmpR family, contains REC and winged-helix (wHTH) domain [Halobacillus alkaliphilus]|uniref:DNA-binding response regulator, OmpR family, contains REC and winged-helix (WHTH) domain n=1 Tax=Halobacillus alkaliphilus TaxID=396056 RepID=A0A1I2K1R6_9BACI|nr:response regulator transcription factor [Halobacillus alkaliphilus]SFF59137.1 DNA-binding response regulator, OmpR family, contains REC and winged-helix (wHTH) domain [Halobacillus alkaliphilus]
MNRVLLVDDEQRMLDLLELYLKPHGFPCEKARSGLEALNKLDHTSYDLILLDVMMKDMDGFETCRHIREKSNVPIMMITAKDQKHDILQGLKLGADDYITKPFDEDILLARMKALLRRGPEQNKIVMNDLVWNEEAHQLHYDNKEIHLTPKEFKLLGLLLNRPNQVYDRNYLLERVWGFDSNTEGRTIDSHVRNVREKIRKHGYPIDRHLKTIWGVGYKWEN